jgi:predicted permease
MTALLPVLFALLLGIFAGRRHEFDAEHAIGFSKLALRFSLPAQYKEFELVTTLAMVVALPVGCFFSDYL